MEVKGRAVYSRSFEHIVKASGYIATVAAASRQGYMQ
jgi:hypothetical protein